MSVTLVLPRCRAAYQIGLNNQIIVGAGFDVTFSVLSKAVSKPALTGFMAIEPDLI
jgi:hypothetical protein